MKKIVTILMFAAALVSCGKQDTVYKPFVKEGGYIYPAKPIELKATSGYQRILLEWDAPMDPSIRTTKLFWDNYSDSLVFSTSDYQDGSIQVWVTDLDDRSYTFDVVNYDAAGNKSLATEITTTPFGESWLLSHAERSFMRATMDGDDAVVTMSKSTDEMVATKFRYKMADGTVTESEYLLPGNVEIRLPQALKGKRVEYKSAFLPVNGKDTPMGGQSRLRKDRSAHRPRLRIPRTRFLTVFFLRPIAGTPPGRLPRPRYSPRCYLSIPG